MVKTRTKIQWKKQGQKNNGKNKDNKTMVKTRTKRQ
jgi:hypothetical protein